ncbi:MAG TPA: flagellar assembly protein FliW [Chloroflexota bacterium]|nr:flagellar assembly protein FliW [Chloroflexota bacterium]
MLVRSARLGPMETLALPEEARLTFPTGLPGFEDYTAFALIEDEYYAPFCWLQSLDDPYISFLLVPPGCVDPDYELALPDEDRESLRLEAGTEPRLYCIVVVPKDVQAMTANLKAPLVINPVRRQGKQVIRTDERYALREPVLRGAAAEAVVQAC